MRVLPIGTLTLHCFLILQLTRSQTLTPNFPCPPLNQNLVEDPSVAITCSPKTALSNKKVPRHAQCIIRCVNGGALRQFSCWEQGWSSTPSSEHCKVTSCVKISQVYPWFDWECSDGNAFGSECTSHCLGPGKESYSLQCTPKGSWHINANFDDPRLCQCQDPDPSWQCQSRKKSGSTCSKECPEAGKYATMVCKPNGEWEIVKDCFCAEPSTQYPGLEWNCDRNSYICRSKCGNLDFIIECDQGEWIRQDSNDQPISCQCDYKPDMKPSLDFGCPGDPPYSQGTICTSKCANGDDFQLTCDENDWVQTSDSCKCEALDNQIPWDCQKNSQALSSNLKEEQFCRRVCSAESQNEDLVLNCLPNGEWDKPSEPCQCQSPSQINENVDWKCEVEKVSMDPLDAGAVCERICDDSSSSETFQMECQSDGLWDSEIDAIKETCSCQEANELFPEIPWVCQNLVEKLSRSITCQQSCNQDSDSNNGFQIQCLPNGSWSNSDTIQKCKCKNPHDLHPHIDWVCSDEEWFASSTCSGDCAGETISITCTIGGSWDDKDVPSECELELKCDQENLDIPNGRISCLIDSKSDETLCTVRCKSGFASKTSNFLTCREQQFQEKICGRSGTKTDTKLIHPECEETVFLLLGGTDVERKALKSTEVYTGTSNSNCIKVPDLPEDMKMGFGVWYQGSVLVCGGKDDKYYKCFVLETINDEYRMLNQGLEWHEFDLKNHHINPRSAGAIDYLDRFRIYGGVDPNEIIDPLSADLRWDGSSCEFTDETIEGNVQFKDHCYVSQPDLDRDEFLEVMCGTTVLTASCFKWKKGNAFATDPYDQLLNPSCALLKNQDNDMTMITVENGQKSIFLGKLISKSQSSPSLELEWTAHQDLLQKNRDEPGLAVFEGRILVFGGETVEEIDTRMNPPEVTTKNEKLDIPRNSPIVVSVPKSRFCNA